jgi:hypothetical protein
LGVVVIALQPQWIAPYATGAAFVGLAWFVHWLLWTGDGAFWQRKGSEAQGWTRGEFKKIRSEGWTAVGPLVFQRDEERFDVDMAAVGPRGVYAVETKYTTDAKLTASTAHWRLSRALWQAKQGASDVADLLFEHGVSADVKPVLVLWGPGAPDFEKGWERLKGVTVVAGRQADTWRPGGSSERR